MLSEDLTRRLEPGSAELGWLAQSGRVPLGYLGDPEKTAATFPVVDGSRYAVAGDRARLGADGSIELHGRDSVCINTGGEKVFAEEVETAITAHPAVLDAVVCGRPSPRWGEEVVAIVALRPDAVVTDEELVTAAGAHLARYKLPRVDPSGRPGPACPVGQGRLPLGPRAGAAVSERPAAHAAGDAGSVVVLPGTAGVDLLGTCRPMADGASDPTWVFGAGAVVRAMSTPEGAATVELRSGASGVTATAWGPGAAWVTPRPGRTGRRACARVVRCVAASTGRPAATAVRRCAFRCIAAAAGCAGAHDPRAAGDLRRGSTHLVDARAAAG